MMSARRLFATTACYNEEEDRSPALSGSLSRSISGSLLMFLYCSRVTFSYLACGCSRTYYLEVVTKYYVEYMLGSPTGITNFPCSYISMPMRVPCALVLLIAVDVLQASVPPPIVVTGGTGRVGSAVIRSLIARRGTAENLFVLARDVDKVKAINGEVTCLCAAYDDIESLTAAFASVPHGFRCFIACNNGPDQASLEGNVCRAAQKAGCTYAVKLSTATPVLDMKQGGPYRAHLEVEALLKQLALPHAVLRPNLFMDEVTLGGFLGVCGSLREADECVHPFANMPISAVDVRDVAACAAALLDNEAPAPTIGQLYEVTGPAAFKLGNDLAEALSELRPRAISIGACSVEEYIAKRQLPPPMAASITGFLNVLATECDVVSDTVLELTGFPARDVRNHVLEHVGACLPATYERLVGRVPAASFGAAAHVITRELDDELAALAPDEVLIRVMVAGVNGGADTFSVTRVTPEAAEDAKPLGSEGVGVVVASGADAAGDLPPGTRVAFIGGAYAEYTRVGAARCCAVDALGDAASQTAVRISGLTAAVALGHTAPVGPGDVVVVTACCGATGAFGAQLAKRAGATVIGTVSSDAKAAVASRILGVDRVVNYRTEELAEVLAREFPDGVDVAYEGVGGPLLGAICANLKPDGRVLLVGAISQYPHNPSTPPHGVAGIPDDLMDGVFRPGKTVDLPAGGSLIGNVWGDAFKSGILPGVRDALYHDLAAGEITALVDESDSFRGVSAIPDAVAHMLSGSNIGKVVARIAHDA